MSEANEELLAILKALTEKNRKFRKNSLSSR